MTVSEIYVGMDIGGTKTAVSLFDEKGRMIFDHKEPTIETEEANELFGFLCGLVFKAFRKCGYSINLLKGIGVGVPSAVDHKTGEILFTPNIPELSGINLIENFSEYFGVRTVIDNDANRAALAEHRFGAGNGYDNMAYITVSTGIGGGIILNGSLLHGSRGYAGEIGHIILDRNSDALCGCGNKGCAEAIASGSGLKNNILRRIPVGISSKLDENSCTGEAIKMAYDQGDKLAAEIIRESAETVGLLLYNINCVLDLDAFVIGGGLTNFGEAYFKGIKDSFMKYSKVDVEIIPASLEENRGTIGAAQLLFD